MCRPCWAKQRETRMPWSRKGRLRRGKSYRVDSRVVVTRGRTWKGGVFGVRSGHNILIPKRKISDENLAPKERGGGLPDVRILGKAPKSVAPFDSKASEAKTRHVARASSLTAYLPSNRK